MAAVAEDMDTETRLVLEGDVSTSLNIQLVRNWAELSVETTVERLNRYCEYLAVDIERLQKMTESFEDELAIGLEHHARSAEWQPDICSFKMIDSCIEKLPTGKETGVFYALDFGGTNFRVVRAKLSGTGSLVVTQNRKLLSECQVRRGGGAQQPNSPTCGKGLLAPHATASAMFNFFADCCGELMRQEGDLVLPPAGSAAAATKLMAGFTFSFPCSQKKVGSATLMEWTKGFETGRLTNDPVEGRDVAELMQTALDRRGVPLQITGVLNDTVGTLLSAAYSYDNHHNSPPCLVGLILGSGVNAAYVESSSKDYGYEGNIINIECGNFNRDLPLSNIDNELDFGEGCNRGRQRLEKMISGAYLGELARRAIVKVLQHLAPEASWIPFSLSSEAVSDIIGDQSEDFATVHLKMLQIWRVSFEVPELQVVHTLCTSIMTRSAAMAAVIVAGTARKSQYLQPAMGGLSIAIDGSLYRRVPFFRQQLRFHLDAILGEAAASLIKFVSADDGSGKGAAILAATLSANNNNNNIITTTL